MNTATAKMLRCSFCGQTQSRVNRVVGGPMAYSICAECIDICHAIIAEGPQDNAGVIYQPRCSFCKAAETDVTRLVPGPGVCICDKCLDICAKIRDELIADDKRTQSSS